MNALSNMLRGESVSQKRDRGAIFEALDRCPAINLVITSRSVTKPMFWGLYYLDDTRKVAQKVVGRGPASFVASDVTLWLKYDPVSRIFNVVQISEFIPGLDGVILKDKHMRSHTYFEIDIMIHPPVKDALPPQPCLPSDLEPTVVSDAAKLIMNHYRSRVGLSSQPWKDHVELDDVVRRGDGSGIVEYMLVHGDAQSQKDGCLAFARLYDEERDRRKEHVSAVVKCLLQTTAPSVTQAACYAIQKMTASADTMMREFFGEQNAIERLVNILIQRGNDECVLIAVLGSLGSLTCGHEANKMFLVSSGGIRIALYLSRLRCSSDEVVGLFAGLLRNLCANTPTSLRLHVISENCTESVVEMMATHPTNVFVNEQV